MDIKITVRRKLPLCGDVAIVCNNSDYTVIWELDEEWSGYDTKTMRTVYKDGTYTDTVFTGDTVALPVVTVPGTVKIGLYAGDIRTSRAALIRALPSITTDGGAPAAPSEDVYNQLMERMAQLETPDWNQNDPDAKDYVKNRPFYVGAEEPAMEICEFNNMSGQYMVSVELNAPLVAGISYVVIINDTTTKSEAQKFENGSIGIPLSLNGEILGTLFIDTEGELIATFSGNPNRSNRYKVFHPPYTPVKKIDPMFLPEATADDALVDLVEIITPAAYQDTIYLSPAGEIYTI